MRIISGILKGRTLKVPAGLPIRPTTDASKEALFNILENRYSFENLKVLDLFSGSGNISYEFVSRGCPSVVCIEKDLACCKFIQSQITQFKLESLKLIHADVFIYIPKINLKFDLIFADPPYHLPNLGNISQRIIELNLLNIGGTFILEHPSLISMSKYPHFIETRIYGTSAFSFFMYSK
jgi:16S rRNA (guanine966-N2)-methyltransferase